MKYIYHHLGLGDHIICNGLVRKIKESYEKVVVFCKTPNYENVSYMFRDDPNIIIKPFDNDELVSEYIRTNNLLNDTIKVGFDKLWDGNPRTFDIGFYNSVNIPFECRFSHFKFLRDPEKEKEIINALNPNNDPFIFLHEDKNRGFLLDRNKIRKDIKIIENDLRFNLFDMLGLIEMSDEVHLMQSSIKDLINSFVIDKPTIYHHTYVRNYPESYNTEGYNKITKID
jgi:hypothetical protein